MRRNECDEDDDDDFEGGMMVSVTMMVVGFMLVSICTYPHKRIIHI